MQVSSAVHVSRDGQWRYYSRRLRTVHFGLIVFGTLVAALGPSSEFANGDPQRFRRACGFSFVVGRVLADSSFAVAWSRSLIAWS